MWLSWGEEKIELEPGNKVDSKKVHEEKRQLQGHKIGIIKKMRKQKRERGTRMEGKLKLLQFLNGHACFSPSNFPPKNAPKAENHFDLCVAKCLKFGIS